jgi:hypothetical protein
MSAQLISHKAVNANRETQKAPQSVEKHTHSIRTIFQLSKVVYNHNKVLTAGTSCQAFIQILMILKQDNSRGLRILLSL